MNMARAIAMGALMRMAPSETRIDPTIKIKAPYFPSLGLQFVEVNISTNEILLVVNDCMPFPVIKTMIAIVVITINRPHNVTRIRPIYSLFQ